MSVVGNVETRRRPSRAIGRRYHLPFTPRGRTLPLQTRHHLGTAGFFSSFGRARNMSEVIWASAGSVTSDNRSSVAFDDTVSGFGILAGVVTYVGDLAPVFVDDARLVRRRLAVAMAGQFSVHADC